MEQVRNLKSIQVFHAVSEHLNVTRAALALNTSQSAVSYHIKKLETEIGAPLFRRTPRGLEATEVGQELAAEVARGLSTIRAGMERAAGAAATLRVAMLPMFASRWLSSRLGAFWEAHPGSQLSIQNHNNTYARMENPKAFADLGIHWGQGAWPDFEATRLWPERLAVVCSPDYLAAKPIRRPSDLRGCMLLHVDDVRMWDEWHRLNGLVLRPDQPQMMLEDRHFQLSSTINGLGVSLFAEWLVLDELREGRLVNPFGHAYDTAFAYYLIQPKGAALTRPAQEFRDWLLEACADHEEETRRRG